ncbi:tetratricopeptide repeat protein, partial [Actinosynnema sp. NPDC023658]|uniref:tetratricopeptide repeat protein n=1 Tax=Actinosynnema sp. NPDC023658 TaxID=3155465 RepID=UPI0033D06904
AERLAADHENLRAALAWYAATDDPDELRLAVTLAPNCRLRGRHAEGRRWLLDALARRPGLTPAERAPAELAAAFLAHFQGSYAEAARLAEAAPAALPYPSAETRCLRLLGSIACERGDYADARVRYAEALARCEAAGDAPGKADVLQTTGFTAWLSGDLDTAEPLLERALRAYGALDDPENAASVRVHLAFVAWHRGQDERARWLAEQAMTVFTALDFREGIAWADHLLGMLLLTAGDVEGALSTLGRSLAVHRDLGDRWRQASVLDALAQGHLALGDPTGAAELTGLATALRDDLGVPVPAVDEPAVGRTRAELLDRLGDQRWYEALDRGGALDVADLVPPARPGAEFGPPPAPGTG